MSSANGNGYLGVTPPISTNESSAREKEVTVTLMEELHRQGIFESEEEAKRREIVLGRLAALVKKFVRRVSLARGLSEAAANAAGGNIYTFGSYRLGVHGPGTDIDTLVVAPRHVTREDFFTTLEEMLREMEGVTEVSISGIPIDLLFAQLALPSIPEDLDLQDDNLLRNLDDKSVRSLNGSRVINEILRLVPNVDVFRAALRCVKLWAQRRAIYSNVNGFLGGVAWAMLVARVCQLYPNAVAGAIVSRFFVIMHQWAWPQPVLLKPIEDGPLQVRVWNPKLYPQDRAHRMPIITPAYPSMCATHNVMRSTEQVMREEFQRGCNIVDQVMKGEAEWSALFEKHDFFHRYRFYLQIIASARDQETQSKWSGTVESKVRQLVMRLEYVDALKLAHPFIKGFNAVYYCLSEEEFQAVSRGEVPEAIAQRKPEDVAGKEGVIPVYTSSYFIGLSIKPKEAGATGPRKLDISYPTTEFYKMVKMWDKFDESSMNIIVRHIKQFVYIVSAGLTGPSSEEIKDGNSISTELNYHTLTTYRIASTGVAVRVDRDEGEFDSSQFRRSPAQADSGFTDNCGECLIFVLLHVSASIGHHAGHFLLHLRQLTFTTHRGWTSGMDPDQRMNDIMAHTNGTIKYLGVTPPISVSESTPREKEVTVTLMEELRRQGTFESEDEAKLREVVLGRLAALVKKFVRKVSLARGLSEAAANAAGGKIFTFGSYRLGVHGPGSDIDTLCVVPKHVSREDFFEVFEDMLKETEGVTEVSGVPDAYVPIIKTKISGIPIDLVMARLALSSIPDDLSLQDDNLLRNLDERCVRSLNGAIVSRFFIIMYQWTWPQPVLLKPIEDGPLPVRVWNPKLYPADRAHRMPIITPAYPSMCATHNVTQSTQMIMTEEFKKASEIVDRVIIGKASWSDLFAKHDFFHKYRYYLQVIASTGSPELQIKWSGTVESRIRQLVMKLEYVESLALAHPFIKGFEQVSYCLNEEEVRAVAQGEISEAIAKRKKEDIEGVEGASTVYSTTFYIGLAVEPRQPGSTGTRRLDISYPTTEFTKLVKMWEKFDENKMGIVVRHIRSSALPDYVFDEGERQPRMAQKRPKTKATDRSSNTSPDVPNKKARLVQSTPTPLDPDCLLMPSRHSISGTNAALPHETLQSPENGLSALPEINTATAVDQPPSSAPVYKPPIKDASEIKSPQLPNGENVAVATASGIP
ncbi:hypothetical protein BN946_scf185015.g142 [Trametes cinnabarina]|uniref:polynucleotide adenylyltransferase n=1 Tax=Pycnoporus cinnabarinus TaxID=5643 RepID=A0A060SN39_PYCCI|nr:hypothetical protein BN946_scf185015.g142 [Trametes cinnabarina]